MPNLRLILFICSYFCTYQSAWTAEPAAKLDEQLQRNLRQHVYTLADDKMQGREAGSSGSRAAAEYIINRLKTYKLKPAGDNRGFKQSFRGRYHNILAIIPGNDPTLSKEYLVIGAHYDHVGYG